jgi:hypothetical protein
MKNLKGLFGIGLALLLFPLVASAIVVVIPATGGSTISADDVGKSFTSLTGPVIAESSVGEIGLGTIVLGIPTGFEFGTTSNSVVVTRASSGNCNGGGNKSVLLNGSNSQTVTPSASSITITVSQASAGNINNCKGTLTWSGIKVRPTAVTPLALGDITQSGTSAISGITNNSTSLGYLVEIAGTPAPSGGGGGGENNGGNQDNTEDNTGEDEDTDNGETDNGQNNEEQNNSNEQTDTSSVSSSQSGSSTAAVAKPGGRRRGGGQVLGASTSIFEDNTYSELSKLLEELAELLKLQLAAIQFAGN